MLMILTYKLAYSSSFHRTHGAYLTWSSITLSTSIADVAPSSNSTLPDSGRISGPSP